MQELHLAAKYVISFFGSESKSVKGFQLFHFIDIKLYYFCFFFCIFLVYLMCYPEPWLLIDR